MSNTIKTTTAQVYKKSSDILVIEFKPDHYVEREHAVEICKALMDLAKNQDHFVLVDALDIASNMSLDAQKYFASENPFINYTKAVAILLNSLPIRLTANTFIKFQKPPFKTKIFKNESVAKEWFQKLD